MKLPCNKWQLEKQTVSKKPNVVSWGIFFATLGIVLITLTSAVFPAFLIRTMGGFPNYSNQNPFETGIWTFPILITDSIVFAITILYFKNKLPQPVTKSIRFLFDFEVSAEIAFIVVAIMIGIFITLTVSQIFTEEPWEDFAHIKIYLDKITFYDIFKEGFGREVKDFLLYSSMHLFGNYKVVPFIESISLLVLTYFITARISKKRFAGIVSVAILLQSTIFATYVSSPTYEYSWALLYLLSLYTIYKKWPLSPLSYVLSLFSKPLGIAFLPMTFFFIYKADVSRQNKIRIAISYVAIASMIAIVFFFSTFSGTIGGLRDFSSHDFWQGFAALSFEFRYDSLILLFILPLTVGLGIASKNGVVHADSILVLIIGMLLLAPLLPALTYETNQPYRFFPLVLFFAMGAGTLLSKNIRRPA